MDQNFVAPGTGIEGFAARDVARASKRAVPAAGRTGMEAARTERGVEQTLNTGRSIFSSAFFFDLAGMAATPFLWVAGKLGLARTGAALGYLKAIPKGLHETKASELFQLPAKIMEAAAEQATKAGAGQWADAASKRSATLATKGAALQKSVTETGVVSSVLKKASGLGERIAQSGIAQKTPTFIKNIVVSAKGMSVLGALMTAGVAFGAGAAVFGARASSKESKAAYNMLLQDIGGNTSSEFARAIKNVRNSDDKWSATKLGTELVGGTAEAITWTSPKLNSMKMFGAMMIPQLCGMMVPDNSALGAYMALRKADAGEIKLDNPQRMELVHQLVAVEPSVARNGGIANRLGKAVTHEMVAQGYTASQVVQLLNDPARFQSLATKVNDTMKAKAAASKTDQPVAEAKQPVQAVPAASIAVVGNAKAANEVPGTRLARVENQGRLQGNLAINR